MIATGVSVGMAITQPHPCLRSVGRGRPARVASGGQRNRLDAEPLGHA